MDRHKNKFSHGWSSPWLSVVVCLSVVNSALGDPPQAPTSAQSALATQPLNAGDTVSRDTGSGDSTSSETDARVQDWIAELSSEEYVIRRNAFMELWKQGPSALPAVRRALTTSDQQTISAAKVLETVLKLDISSTDNDGLADLLKLSISNWEATIESLGQKGYWGLAAEVVRGRPALAQNIRETYPPNGFNNLTQAAFDQGNAFESWPVIAQCLAPERRFYLTELTRKLLTQQYKGRIPEEIESALNVMNDEATLDVDERALYYLYSGKAKTAWELNPNPRVKQRIIFHSANWEWLKDASVASISMGSGANTLLRRARLAAYNRLARDDAKCAELVGSLRTELERTDLSQNKQSMEGSVQDLLKALVVCGEGDLVDELITRSSLTTEIDYLTYRFQHDKVFKKFGLDVTLANFDEWIVELPGKLNPSGPQVIGGMNRIESYLELTRFFVHTGFSDQAQTLYTTLIDSIRRLSLRESLDKWNDLLNRSEDHQIRNFLLKYLDENDQKLKPEERRLILVRVYSDWENTVEKLWQHAPAELSKIDGKAMRWRLLERLWKYDRTLVQDKAGARAVEDWLTTAVREASKGEEPPAEAVGEMATVALRLGLRRQALAMARTELNRNTVADVAEMLTANSSFELAGKYWEIAIRQSPQNHMWVRRYADVLLLQGDAETAAKYESSIWLRPLGSQQLQTGDITYAIIAEKYFDSGDYDLAQAYSEASVALGDIGEQGWRARRMASMAMEREDYATAARGSRIFLLNLLFAPSNIVRTPWDSLQFIQYYTGQDLLCNAANEIQAGRIETALSNIAKFESLLPSGIEVCEHCYPLLIKAGQQQAADQLLDRCAARMLKHLQAWPNDSNSHNNLAWMLARCNARIPEAIEHATKAVQLSDRSPTYVDTLAEAEFRAGHIDQAIELARECTETDPRHAHYQKQLQRFRSQRQ